jgi:RNA polymerase sigma-70 factor (ECF subfamily)
MDARDPKQVVDSLFHEWAEPLYRHAYRLTRCRARAEDVVQEAFLAYYVELRRGNEVLSPRGWMLALVANRAARVFRNERRWEQTPDGMENLPASPGEADDAASFDDLLPLMSLLSPRENEVVLLRLQSMKYRDIAAQLGISPKSVATLLARALAKLREGVRRTREFTGNPAISRQKNAPLQ